MPDNQLKQAIFHTELGWIGISSRQNKLRQITLPLPSAKDAEEQLGINHEPASHLNTDLIERLTAYLEGKRVSFNNDQLDLTDCSPFQRRVWETTRLIPYGETRTYSWVARQIGHPKAARAVGQALGKNPLPIIIPCHRVTATGGNLGGYSGGLSWKRTLLQLEASRATADSSHPGR